MIVRKKLDIGWTDIAFGLGACLLPGDAQAAQKRLEAAWSPAGDAIACLSVRTGFDLLLAALALPAGSEILVSAITIGDMVRIIERHGLVAVPIDLDMASLSIRAELISEHVTARTKAIVVAHLFGSRMAMEPISAAARRHELLVIEDCAQAFAADGYRGSAQSDVSLFSFGPIKTATALGGALLRVSDAGLRTAMLARQRKYPAQRRAAYVRKLMKCAALKALSYRLPYGLFAASCSLLQTSHDAIIGQAARSFAGMELFLAIRLRCDPRRIESACRPGAAGTAACRGSGARHGERGVSAGAPRCAAPRSRAAGPRSLRLRGRDLRHELLQGVLVVRKIDVALRRRRLASPAALDLGAQCKHVPEALHVEARVARQAEFRIGHQLPGARSDFRRDLEALDEDSAACLPVGRRNGPAVALDQRGDVALERVGVRLRPAAQRERAARLVGADEIDRAAHALQPGRLRIHRKRRIEPRSLVVLVFAHAFQPQERAADRMDPVVGAFLQTVHSQDLFQLQRIGGVRGIDQQRVALQVRVRAYVGLNKELVHAAVAARDDHDVVPSELDHCYRVVHRGLRDLEIAGGKAVALLLRIDGEQHFHLQAMALKDALGCRRHDRQRLGTGKYLHPERGLRKCSCRKG